MSAQIDWLAVSEALSEDGVRLYEEAQQFLKSGKPEVGVVKAQLSELTILLARALLCGIKATHKTQKETKQ